MNNNTLKWAIPLLRVSIATILLWFGLTKILDAGMYSSMNSIIYEFFPDKIFITVTGSIEIIIGVCLLLNFLIREMIVVYWFQTVAVMLCFILNPSIFLFHDNIFFLSVEGEFIVTNLILVSSSIVLHAHTPKRRVHRHEKIFTKINTKNTNTN